MKKYLWVFLLIALGSSSSAYAGKGDIVIARGAFDFIIDNRFLEHAGIDTGEGTVIEFAGGNGSEGIPVIREIPIETFRHNSPEKKFEYMDFAKTFPDLISHEPNFVVSVAREYLRNGGVNFGTYNPLMNNCQHFVLFCKSGVRQSWQVNAFSQFTVPLRQNETVSGFMDVAAYTVAFLSEFLLSTDK